MFKYQMKTHFLSDYNRQEQENIKMYYIEMYYIVGLKINNI